MTQSTPLTLMENIFNRQMSSKDSQAFSLTKDTLYTLELNTWLSYSKGKVVNPLPRLSSSVFTLLEPSVSIQLNHKHPSLSAAVLTSTQLSHQCALLYYSFAGTKAKTLWCTILYYILTTDHSNHHIKSLKAQNYYYQADMPVLTNLGSLKQEGSGHLRDDNVLDQTDMPVWKPECKA